MSSSAALRWVILPLLLLTLGWKIAAQLGDAGELKEKDGYLKVAEFLVRQHFNVAMASKLEEGAPVIQATAGVCRILIAGSGSEGSDRDRIRSYATAADVVFVVFGGTIYSEQPTWLTTVDALWSKFRRELGLKTQPTPAFVVIATKSCAAERLPWGQLG